VDDSPDDLEMYAEYLAANGFDLEFARDGEQAVQIALNKPLEAAVIDIAMPRLDGIQVVMTLRNYAATRHLPLVTLSARTGIEARTAALDAGADLALEKPCMPDQLLALLRGLLKEGKMRGPAAP
jgi:DNA-binding response OmpR family regulator